MWSQRDLQPRHSFKVLHLLSQNGLHRHIKVSSLGKRLPWRQRIKKRKKEKSVAQCDDPIGRLLNHRLPSSRCRPIKFNRLWISDADDRVRRSAVTNGPIWRPTVDRKSGKSVTAYEQAPISSISKPPKSRWQKALVMAMEKERGARCLATSLPLKRTH